MGLRNKREDIGVAGRKPIRVGKMIVVPVTAYGPEGTRGLSLVFTPRYRFKNAPAPKVRKDTPLGLKPQAESCSPFGTKSDCPYGTSPTTLNTSRRRPVQIDSKKRIYTGRAFGLGLRRRLYH